MRIGVEERVGRNKLAHGTKAGSRVAAISMRSLKSLDEEFRTKQTQFKFLHLPSSVPGALAKKKFSVLSKNRSVSESSWKVGLDPKLSSNSRFSNRTFESSLEVHFESPEESLSDELGTRSSISGAVDETGCGSELLNRRAELN